MINDFQSVKEKFSRRIKEHYQIPIVSVAVAEDKEVLKTLKQVIKDGFVKAILVGQEGKIKSLLSEENMDHMLDDLILIEDVDDEIDATRRAVDLVLEGKAQMLMKGLVNSSIFLRAIIDGEKRKERKSFLSHLAAIQVPSLDRLLFITDAGMNVSPSFEDKEKILKNALDALHKLGFKQPKVAVMAANEKVDPRIPAAVDAEAMVKKWEEGFFPNSIIEGPVAMDVALSKQAAIHKGISSKLAGETDLFLMPDLQSGNMVSKTILYCAGGTMAGVVLGTPYSIIMTSRAESAEGKINSIIMGAVLAEEK